MALTYYIRSWDPRSTYPSNPQEGDICYTITLDQTWAPVGGVKKDNIVKEEVYQNGAWVEQGGGGSSETVLYDGAYTTVELSPGFYGVPLLMYESVPFEPLPTYIKAVYSGETIMLPLANEDNAIYGEVDGEGMPIFDNYPIAIALSGDGDYATTMMLVTPTAETGSFKASAKLSGGGGDVSPYTTCIVSITKDAGISGDSYFALPTLHENPSDPVYGIVSDVLKTGGSWASWSVPCVMYDGHLTLFMQGGNDKFYFTSGSAQVSQDGSEVYIEGDCEIEIRHK